MNLEMFVTWIVVGLLTGGLSSFVMNGRGYGRTWDVILGLAGSGAASTVVSALVTAPDAGMGAMAITAFAGAALIIVLQRKVWPSRPVRSVRAVR
jgi:uncharacterized membrane protein YeaQ/YmgE (transglycosylase-associated protein family)